MKKALLIIFFLSSNLVWAELKQEDVKIPIPEFVSEDDPAIYITRVRYAFAAVLDGQEIYRFPQTDSSSFSGVPIHLFRLPHHAEGKTLYLKITSPIERIGLTGKIEFGNYRDLLRQQFYRDMSKLVVFLACVFVSLLLIPAYYRNRQMKAIIYLMVFITFFGIYNLCTTGIKDILTDWDVFWTHLQMAMVYPLPGVFLLFLSEIFAGKLLKVSRLFAYANILFALVCVILCIFNMVFPPQTTDAFQLVAIVLFLVIALNVALLFRHRNQVYWILTSAIIVMIFCGVHDIFVARDVLPWKIDFSPVGNLYFIAATVLVLMNYVDRQLAREKILTKELKDSGMVQKKFLGSDSYVSERVDVEVFFAPAVYSGGDWFYHRLIENRYLFIFCGDVSGHGPGAAIIGAFTQGVMASRMEDLNHGKPFVMKEFHEEVNKFLFSIDHGLKTSKTLFTAIIDTETGEMEYINSGHPSPIVVESDSDQCFSLRARNKSFIGHSGNFVSREVEKLQLKPGQKLHVFSDGLTEFVFCGQNLMQFRKWLLEYKTKTTFVEMSRDLEERFLKALEKYSDQADDVTLMHIAFK